LVEVGRVSYFFLSKKENPTPSFPKGKQHPSPLGRGRGGVAHRGAAFFSFQKDFRSVCIFCFSNKKTRRFALFFPDNSGLKMLI
jgi:hypothetical protein